MGKAHHPGRLAAALLSLALMGGAGFAAGQGGQEATPPPPVETKPAEAPATALLEQAIAAIAKSPAIQTETDYSMVGKSEGASFTFRERIRVTAKKPGKFRSEVAFTGADGSAGAKFTVVSDGAKVWVHRPGTKQYAVFPKAAFAKGDDELPALGLLASFYLDAAMPDAATLKEIGGTRETVDGAEYAVYTLEDKKGGFATRFFVREREARLHRITISGKSGGMDLTITDTVVGLSTAPQIEAGTFTFRPPAGTKQVKTLPLEPFK